MSDQQGTDDRDRQDPYPKDQAFGAAAAEDQERVDRGDEPATDPADAPKPGNKA